jgi:hypothetical protein
MSMSGTNASANVTRLSDHAPGYFSPLARLQQDLADHREGRLSLTVLRQRWSSENNSHRNMLQRRMEGAIVASGFQSFPDFLEAMGPKPARSYTLDRIDPYDPEYAPGKVRWASKRTQSNNRRNTVYLTCSTTGATLPLSQWSKRLKVSVDTLRKRRERGWTDDQIVSGKGPGATAPQPSPAPVQSAAHQPHRPYKTSGSLFARASRDDLLQFVPWPHIAASPEDAKEFERMYSAHGHRSEHRVLFALRWFSSMAGHWLSCHQDESLDQQEHDEGGRQIDYEASVARAERYQLAYRKASAAARAAQELSNAWHARWRKIKEQDGLALARSWDRAS